MKKTSIISALASVLALAASCTAKENSTAKAVAIRAEVSLGTSYAPAKDFKSMGTISAPTWSTESKAVMLVEGTEQKAVASPMTKGKNSSMFVFNVNTALQEVPAVCCYPADAKLTFTGGKLTYDIPTQQDGSLEQAMFDIQKVKVGGYDTPKFSLKPGSCLVLVNVAMGDYDIVSLELKTNGGEKIAGKVEANLAESIYSASESSIKVTLPSAVSCINNSIYIPVWCAPGTIAKGVTAVLTTSTGETITSSTDEELVLEPGGRVCTSKMAEGESTELVFCGDNHVFVLNATVIKDSYKEGIVWSWDAKTAAKELGIAESRCDHLDDCKFVDRGKKLLLTSSYGWCALIEYPSGKVLFHTTQTPNAHSAEYIPDGGGYIVVANSEGASANHNKVQLYDVTKSEVVLASAALATGHGVVWDTERKLLYAGGDQYVKTFAIDGLGTANPKFVLKKNVRAPQGGIHDMLRVDANTITVAGARAYLYNVVDGTFPVEMPLFSASSSIKSLNYNAETGEMWYTDATGNPSWSTHEIRYSKSYSASKPDRIIRVDDINMYKVRVKNW